MAGRNLSEHEPGTPLACGLPLIPLAREFPSTARANDLPALAREFPSMSGAVSLPSLADALPSLARATYPRPLPW
jgi:hypothetical protein